MTTDRNIFMSLKQVLLPLALYFISLFGLFMLFLNGQTAVLGHLAITIRNNPDIKEKAISLATFIGLMAGFILAYIVVVIAAA